MNRRDFLKLSGKTVAALGMSDVLLEMILSEWNHKAPIALANENQPIFVSIQLSGGNDGISTVIPYADSTYYDERPTLAYKPREIIRIDSRIGLHPSLIGIKTMYDEGKLALIEGVGYPNPDRSHFRASEIWQTANPEKIDQTGWLGRYLDVVNEQKYPLTGLSIGSTSKIFLAKNNYVPTINDIRRFKFVMDVGKDEEQRRNYYFDKMYRNTKEENLLKVARKGMAALKASNEVNTVLRYEPPQSLYPEGNEFAQQLSFIAQCVSSPLGTKAYFIESGGYDEHENEKNNHMQVLTTLDQGIYAFYHFIKT